MSRPNEGLEPTPSSGRGSGPAFWCAGINRRGVTEGQSLTAQGSPPTRAPRQALALVTGSATR
jgi:hypothetical protein